jgi:hypothetical protein
VQLSGIGERNWCVRRDQAGRGRKRNLAVSKEGDRLLDLAANYDGPAADATTKDHFIFAPKYSNRLYGCARQQNGSLA